VEVSEATGEKRGRTVSGKREERYNRVEHPSHAVAAQPHFATSILPARLHSHSVDPFTEGMSHMPPSPPLPSPFPPLFPLRRILSSPSNPRTLLSAACTPPAITVSVSYAVSLSILSYRPSLSSTRARQRLPSRPPIPLSPRHYLSFFLSRSLCTPLKCPSFSPSLLCDRGAVAALRGEVGEGGCTFCRISESRALLICRT